MVKNKDLPDSAAPPVWSFSLSLSLSLSPLSLTDLALSRLVSRIFSRRCLSSWGYPLDPAEAGPRHHFLFDHFKFTVLYEHSRFLCSTVLHSIELYFHHQTHSQLGGFFFFFHFGSASSFLQTIHGVLKIRMLKWFAIPISSGMRFVRTCHHDPSFSGGPAEHGSQFHWVRHGCTPCDQLVSCSGLTWIILTNTQDYERHSAGRSCWRATPQENTEHIFIGNLSCNL